MFGYGLLSVVLVLYLDALGLDALTIGAIPSLASLASASSLATPTMASPLRVQISTPAPRRPSSVDDWNATIQGVAVRESVATTAPGAIRILRHKNRMEFLKI